MLDLRKGALVGAVVSSALFLAACNLYKSPLTSQPPAGQQEPISQQQPEPASVITYSDDGFSPSEIKVKVGEAVGFKNNSSGGVQVNSVPHPVHTSFPELNIGVVASGETKSVTFTKSGTYKYHNHLNPGQGGTIVVE